MKAQLSARQAPPHAKGGWLAKGRAGGALRPQVPLMTHNMAPVMAPIKVPLMTHNMAAVMAPIKVPLMTHNMVAIMAMPGHRPPPCLEGQK